jgi:uncharacterized GH25 family protein
MRRLILLVLAIVLTVDNSMAHDLFLKLDSYFLRAGDTASVALVNGTFEKSENTIDRDRIADASIVLPDSKLIHPEPSQWRDEEARTMLDLVIGEPGTYLVGVSTKPRGIELSAEEFNEYLEHDGVLDVLAERKKDGTTGDAANERYSKHVKAVIQIGDRRTPTFDDRLGYPIEIVPLDNPYDLQHGDSLRVRVYRGDRPLANQLIYSGHDEAGHGHSHGPKVSQTRTDDNGEAEIELPVAGRWYVRLIHMERVDKDGFDHESNWATLTFQIE